ncbi:hypothetical protein [Micromonospora carbonacea]|uniref:hypothetical protein n=1 Tax=Micromonospora carbonacea TaxID=47853 RepID=UPI003D71714F
MTLASSAITAAVALLGVLLGGYLSLRNQDRLWARDHARQWRDIRLSAYREFLAAYRHYLAFALEPTANITAAPHPRHPGELMPFFDEAGRPYKERLEGGFATVRLVSELPETVPAAIAVVIAVRQIAAARATIAAVDISSAALEKLTAAELEFFGAIRRELGLAPLPENADVGG